MSDDFFFKINLFKIFFWNTIRVSNCLDPDQDRHSVGPDLGPNCLQIKVISRPQKLPLSSKGRVYWLKVHCIGLVKKDVLL